MLTTPDHSDAVTSPPAAAPVGPHPQGFYQDCDPATGRAGTIYRAEEFNELIQNLRQFLTSAAVPGVKGTATLLTQALARLYAGKSRTLTGTQTLTADDAGLILIDATSGSVTLTLPAASVLPGGFPTFQFVRLDSASANTVRVIPAGSDTIRGGIAYLVSWAPFIIRSDGVSVWHPLQVAYVIATATTINVAPTGVATPRDPIGGDAFATLPQALLFLSRHILQAPVTIRLAAGTYVHTVPIDVSAVDSAKISIQGASVATTILQFNGCGGFNLTKTLNRLGNMTIQGNQLGGTSSVGVKLLNGWLDADALTIRNFASYGLQLDWGSRFNAFGTLTVDANLDNGILVRATSILYGIAIVATNNGGDANVHVGPSCLLSADSISTTGGARGAMVDQGNLASRQLLVNSPATLTESVVVKNMGQAQAAGTSVAGDWNANTPAVGAGVFKAMQYGFILSLAAFNTTVRGLTSPAVNTTGNIQSYVQAN